MAMRRLLRGLLLLLPLEHCAGEDVNDVILPREGQRIFFKYTSEQAGADHRLLHMLNELASPRLDIYNFGVYTGTGLHKLSSVRNFGHLWGFDSFHGLPSQDTNESLAWRSSSGKDKGAFNKGGYSAADATKVYNLTALMSFVASRVGRRNMTLVPGYFSDSLTPQLLQRYTFQPALHVDCDVDIYVSTMQSLDWMLANKLLVPSSTVRYDDWPTLNASHGPASGTNFYGMARAHY